MKRIIFIFIFIILFLLFLVMSTNLVETFLKNKKQENFAKVLLNMDKVLSENNQTYFLTCGTLLGVVRENKFINHDEDIDLGIFKEDLVKDIDLKILSTNIFRLKHRLGNPGLGYELSFTHNELDISIDLFIYYKNNDYYWSASYFNICDETPNKMCRWKYTPFTLQPILFLEKAFFIPNDINLFLEESYGKDWKIPKKFSYNEGLSGDYTNLMYEDFEKEGIVPTQLTVWQYWEDPKLPLIKPEYIKFCMNSVKRRCELDGINYVCLNPNNI